MKLMQMGNFLSNGYHIFIDNFFATVSLASTLYKLGIFITGTIRRNRKFLPQAFQNKLQSGEKKYFRTGLTFALAEREENLNMAQFCCYPRTVEKKTAREHGFDKASKEIPRSPL
jgi:hypothetical protein